MGRKEKATQNGASEERVFYDDCTTERLLLAKKWYEKTTGERNGQGDINKWKRIAEEAGLLKEAKTPEAAAIAAKKAYNRIHTVNKRVKRNNAASGERPSDSNEFNTRRHTSQPMTSSIQQCDEVDRNVEQLEKHRARKLLMDKVKRVVLHVGSRVGFKVLVSPECYDYLVETGSKSMLNFLDYQHEVMECCEQLLNSGQGQFPGVTDLCFREQMQIIRDFVEPTLNLPVASNDSSGGAFNNESSNPRTNCPSPQNITHNLTFNDSSDDGSRNGADSPTPQLTNLEEKTMGNPATGRSKVADTSDLGGCKGLSERDGVCKGVPPRPLNLVPNACSPRRADPFFTRKRRYPEEDNQEMPEVHDDLRHGHDVLTRKLQNELPSSWGLLANKRMLTDLEWRKILQHGYKNKRPKDELANLNSVEWTEVVKTVGITTSKTGEQIMADFFSYCIPNIEMLDLPGHKTPVDMDIFTDYAFMVIYHSIEKAEKCAVRKVIENLQKRRILTEKIPSRVWRKELFRRLANTPSDDAYENFNTSGEELEKVKESLLYPDIDSDYD